MSNSTKQSSDDHDDAKLLTRVLEDYKEIKRPAFYRRHFALHQTGSNDYVIKKENIEKREKK